MGTRVLSLRELAAAAVPTNELWRDDLPRVLCFRIACEQMRKTTNGNMVEIYNQAIDSDDVAVMVWAWGRAPLPPSAIYRAAEAGALECLTYAREHGTSWHDLTTLAAAKAGSLPCLRYAHENGAPWHVYTTAAAAGAGSLPCLRYAHENGAPWDPDTIWHALRVGSLPCLRYAHEQGAPWYRYRPLVCTHAPDCLEYIRQIGKY